MKHLTEEEKIRAIMSENVVLWARNVLGPDPKPEHIKSLATLDKVAFVDFVKQNGFGSEVASYKPLESRYLIENTELGWEASFYERGRRFSAKLHSTKQSAEEDIIDRLIRQTALLIGGDYNLKL